MKATGVNQPGRTVAMSPNSSTPETYDVVSFSGFFWLLFFPQKKVTKHITRVNKNTYNMSKKEHDKRKHYNKK